MTSVTKIVTLLVVVGLLGQTSAYWPAPPCASSCSGSHLGAFLKTQSWQGKNHKRGPNWCFGTKSGNVLFSRRMTYIFPPIDDSHHVAILCRVATSSTNIDGGSVYSVDQRSRPVSVIQLTDKPREKIFVMNSTKKAANVDMYVTFWSKGKKENAVVECQSYAGGAKDCDYQDDVFPQNANPVC